MPSSENPFAYRKPITLDSLTDLFAHHSAHLSGWKMEDGGEEGGEQAGNDQQSGTGEYKPPASQADLDRIVGDRLARERARYGGLTPEDLKVLREKADRQDALENELASDKEKAVKEARTTVEQEQAAKYRPMLAETAFRVAIGDRKPSAEVDDFIADLNLDRFLTGDGKVDTSKVLARVEQFAPKSAEKQRRGPTLPRSGAGTPGSSASLGNLGGSELYDRLHPKKTA